MIAGLRICGTRVRICSLLGMNLLHGDYRKGVGGRLVSASTGQNKIKRNRLNYLSWCIFMNQQLEAEVGSC